MRSNCRERAEPGAGVCVHRMSGEDAPSCRNTKQVVPARQARTQRGTQFLVCECREPLSKAEWALGPSQAQLGGQGL